jgi:hypothetical protein
MPREMMLSKIAFPDLAKSTLAYWTKIGSSDLCSCLVRFG